MDLDSLFHEARPEVPEGLAARLIAGARSAEAQRRIFWADVERTGRRALAVAAAAAVITVGLAVSMVVSATAPDNTRTASLVEITVQAQLEKYLESP